MQKSFGQHYLKYWKKFPNIHHHFLCKTSTIGHNVEHVNSIKKCKEYCHCRTTDCTFLTSGIVLVDFRAFGCFQSFKNLCSFLLIKCMLMETQGQTMSNHFVPEEKHNHIKNLHFNHLFGFYLLLSLNY